MLLDLVGIRARLIHFIDSDDYRYSGSLRVVDSFYCLRHNTVVRGHNEDSNIRCLRASRSHCCERLVTRCVEEGDRLVVDDGSVRADVLCNTAGFSLGYVGVADSVED